MCWRRWHTGGRGRQQRLRQSFEPAARFKAIRYHDGWPKWLYGWLYRGRIIWIVLHRVPDIPWVTGRRSRIHRRSGTVHLRQLLAKSWYRLVMLQLFIGRRGVHSTRPSARTSESHSIRRSTGNSILWGGLVRWRRQEGSLRRLWLRVSAQRRCQ